MFSHINLSILSYGMISEESQSSPICLSSWSVLISSKQYNSTLKMNFKYFLLFSYINMYIFSLFSYFIYFQYVINNS